ncbi:MAG: hypothetical protein IJW43_06635 [Clostridia bacterium]|nr:hypothetical protein [Clostridia bacterium]
MKSIQEIKEDLKMIRYYYSKEKEFEAASKVTGKSNLTLLIEKYNQAVRNAPIRLYEVYVSLYVHNNTQLVLSFDLDCSPDYVRKLNNKCNIHLLW